MRKAIKKQLNSFKCNLISFKWHLRLNKNRLWSYERLLLNNPEREKIKQLRKCF